MNIDPTTVCAVIIANPDLRVAPDLLLWLLDSGVPRRQILVTRGDDRDQCVAYNWAVQKAISRPSDYCLFADADVRPCELTDPLWTAPYDLTCAMTDTEVGCDSWRHRTDFHSALWIARRSALASLRAPWFAWPTTPDGSKITGCVCGNLAGKAKAAGLTIGHAGYAHHWPRGAKFPDAIPLQSAPVDKAKC